MTQEIDEACALIKSMGFDHNMARNLMEIVQLSVQAGRGAAIEECAKAAENYDHRDIWSNDPDMQAQGYWAAGETCDEIAKAIRALSAVTLTDRKQP